MFCLDVRLFRCCWHECCIPLSTMKEKHITQYSSLLLRRRINWTSYQSKKILYQALELLSFWLSLFPFFRFGKIKVSVPGDTGCVPKSWRKTWISRVFKWRKYDTPIQGFDFPWTISVLWYPISYSNQLDFSNSPRFPEIGRIN